MSADAAKSLPQGLLATISALNPDALTNSGTAGKLTEADKKNLHALLDAILDLRDAFEALSDKPKNYLNALAKGLLELEPNPETKRLADLSFNSSIALVMALLGPMRSKVLPPLSNQPERAREVLWIWLARLRRLLPGRLTGMWGSLPQITLDQLLEELQDLSLGDQGSIFAAAPRKPGQKRKTGKLARLRLKALAWERYLRSQGMRPGEAQAKVCNAFGESWNTIEKWRKRVCVRHLGEWMVDFELRSAEEGQPPSFGLLGWEAALSADGQTYRETLKAAKV